MDYFRSLHTNQLKKAEAICGYSFKNKSGLYEALLMAGSAAAAVNPALQEGNKRLALVGDHVLALVVRLHSYGRGDKIGVSTNFLASVVNNRFLGEIGFKKQLHECVVKGHSHLGPISQYQMATAIEAIIGAAYMESGVEAAEIIIKSLGILK